MKSAFGSKRKARKIEVDEDDGGLNEAPQSTEPINTRTYEFFAVERLADIGYAAD
jgi:hypothetical protein